MTNRPLRFGLWYDFRNPPRWRQDPARLHEAIFRQIERAEELGWDDVWLSEHHFLEDGYTPSMLPLACAIAARTKRVRIGTSVLLLPLHDPIRVAEDAAVIDCVSNGRFELGIGAGYRKAEFEGFRVALTDRGGRMREGTKILRRLLDGERFALDGRYYRTGEIELHPRPVQRRMPIWMGGFTEIAVRRAARQADGYIAIGAMRALVDVYHAELEKLGKDPSAHEVAGGLFWLIVARDPERRWREAREHFTYQVNLYASWFAEAGMDFIRPIRSDDDLRAQGVVVCRPEEAIEKVRAYVAENRVTRFYGWTVPPGLPAEWADEHVELMAKEVIPAFR